MYDVHVAYLAHLQIALGKLFQHVLCAQGIIQLLLEILNLRFRTG
jgi:hypothetical protein